MTLALLVITLSARVQAGVIPIPAAGKQPDDAAIGSASVNPGKTEPVYEAMDPSKMDVFERAEDVTKKFLAKRTASNTVVDAFQSKRADADAAAVPQDRDLSVGTDTPTATTTDGPKTEAVFEPMDPSKMVAFESAEDATAKFLAKRATKDDRDFSVRVDDDSEKHETIRPPPPPICLEVCPDVYDPLCAKNSKGFRKTFGNECELAVFNCKYFRANFKEERKGKCEE
ncbi:hypothetical protein BGZ95_010051 [Linnemannia exigua]|uniref:Kazal-like domain-containing protein n=1 Tax=Linnemannia exigua TaxID=604196 RepID=A0AAD4H6M3_9FUNG|nr:hypothetical protein BGZ95_010051 [Linnemannia exigua]